MSVRRPRFAPRFASLLVALAFVLGGNVASATVDGTRPGAFQSFRVFGDSLSVGNTLMSNLPAQPLVNAILLDESSAAVSGIPTGATIEGAYVFWTGSTDPDIGVDRAATMTFANGAARVISADLCREAVADFGPGADAEYFYCRADVTAQVAANPVAGGHNGVYSLGGVAALPGFLGGGGACIDPLCQAYYAGWSMVIVWSSEEESTLRDVNLFDGFQLFDETPFSTAVDSFAVGGFDVADPPEATYRFFGLEGDALLGVPPQDSDPVLGCDTCFDYVSFNGTKLSDSLNAANNIFNSSLPEGSAIGVDIDSYDVSDLVTPGDTSVRIEIGSGDNNTATGHDRDAGGGELFLVGYHVLTINRLSPNFRSRNTFISADPTEASPGETIFYTVVVTNDGSLPGTNLSVQVPLPPNTEYIAGSTRLDGGAVSDVGGASAIFGGLSLGTLSNIGDNDRRITFRVRILPDTPNGTIIRAAATIDADELTEPTVTEEAVVTVVAPTLLTPQKTALDLNGGLLEPGDFVTYTVRLRKDAERSAAGLTFVDDITEFATLQSVNASGFVDESDLAGGANGTGQVRISDISMPVGSESATVSFTVRVLSSDELVAAGVDPADIDGLVIRNQGELQAEFLPSSLLTDDPATGAEPDPTDLRVSSSVNFRNPSTFKVAEDLNGGLLEPGDTIRFTISVSNSGSQVATVDVADDLPASLSGARVVSAPTGFIFDAAPAGANGTGRFSAIGRSVDAGETLRVLIEAEVADDATNGTAIENIASLTVPAFPDQSQELSAGVLTVTAGAVFSGATKIAEGGAGGFEPGDTVTYRIAFTNEGNQDAAAVSVTDVIASELTAITPADGGVYDPGSRTITWNVGAVAVGGSGEVSFTARIGVAVPSGTSISNQATVTSETGTAFVSDDPATAAEDDPTVIRVEALPAPEVEKTVVDINGGAFEPGDRIRYTLAVTNSGRASLNGVVISDVVPDTLLDVNPIDGALAGNTASWSAVTTAALAEVLPGQVVLLQLEATIAAGLGDGTVISNQATLAAEGGFEALSDDPTTGELFDPTDIVISAEADLTTSTKSVFDENGGAPQPGDLLTYTIGVTNTGTGAARDVIVTDVISDTLIDIVPADGGFFDVGTRTITWTPAAAVGPGTTLELQFRASIAPGTTNGTIVDNQALVESPDLDTPVLTDDPDTPAVDDPTRIVVESRPDFATSSKEVFHAGGEAEFRPGDEVLYRLTVRNTGTENATEIRVTDPVDSSLVDIEAGEGGVFDGTTITWTIAALDAGEEIVVSFRGTLAFPLADGTVVSNQATIEAPGAPAELTDDPSTVDEDDSTDFEVVSRPDLSSSLKTFVDADGGSVRPGDRVDYVVVVINTGSEAATDVVVTDTLDPNLVLLDAGDAIVVGNTLTWDSGTTPGLARVTVGDGGAVELRFAATVVSPLDNGTFVDNQALIDVGGEIFLTDDPTTAADSDPTRFQVISSFDFSDTIKLASPPAPGGYRPGDDVTYSIRFSNSGDSLARNVLVSDPLDPNVLFVSATSGGVFDGTRVLWNSGTTGALAAVAPGESVDLQATVRIVAPLANGTLITNQASISADGAAAPFVSDDPTTDAIDDATDFSVTSAARFSASTKTVEDIDGDGVFEPGDEVLYTIILNNDGDAVGDNVSVTDPLPAELVSVVPLDGGVSDGASLNWNSATTPALAGVAPGETATVRFRGTIRVGTSDGTIVSNQATVTAFETLPAPTDDPSNGLGDDDATSFRVVAQPRLDGLTKSVEDLNGGILLAGDELRYTLVVRNDGTEPAADVVVRDPIPAALVDIAPADGGVFSGGAVVWSIGALDVGAERSVSFSATVAGSTPAGTPIVNQAFAEATGLVPEPSDDPTTADVDDPTAVVVNNVPDLSQSSKAVTDIDGGFLEPGDLVRYTFLVSNTGFATAERVTVRDVVDLDALTELAPEDDGVVSGNTVSWALGDIEAGSSRTFSLVARVRDDVENQTAIANQALVSDASGIAEVTDDPATPLDDDETVIVVEFPELDASTLSVNDLNGEPAQPGDVLRYSIVVGAGNGPTLTDVGAAIPIPAELTDIVGLSGGVFDAGTSTLTFTSLDTGGLATIPTGTETLVEFEATVVAGTPVGTIVPVQGRLTSDEVPFGVVTDDPTTPELDDPTLVEVAGATLADLSETTKTVVDLNGDFVEPGDELAYAITIPNNGVGATVALTLTDPLPIYTTFVTDSLTVDGIVVPSQESPLGSGLSLPDLPVGGQTVVEFRVRVDDDTPVGTVISNVAVASELGGAVAPSDDPATDEVDDPTDIVVGGSPNLSRALKTATPVDENGDGIAQSGESIRYRIEVPNRGTETALAVRLVDPIADNGTYLPGSITVQGEPQTDEADGDLAQFFDGRVEVLIGTIPVGRTAIIEFTVVANSGARIENQGFVEFRGGFEATDDDGNPANGQNPTVTPLDGSSSLTATKTVADADGGTVNAGDTLIYTVQIESGVAGETGLLVDQPDPGVTLTSVIAQPAGIEVVFVDGGAEISVLGIEPGTPQTILLEATLDGGLQRGDVVCNRIDGELASPVEPACIGIGGRAGVASVDGFVFRELGEANGLFDADSDEGLEGFVARVVRADVGDLVVNSSRAREGGAYDMQDVDPGEYLLQVFAGSPEAGAAVFAERPLSLVGGAAAEEDVLIDPTGIIYASDSRIPVSGVRVYVYDGSGGDQKDVLDLARVLDSSELPQPSQQGQVVPPSGMYRLDLPPNRDVEIFVDTAGSPYLFPSLSILPTDEDVLASGRVELVDSVLPAQAPLGEESYALTVSATDEDSGVFKNHLPVDAIDSDIVLTKRADRAEAYVGDIITYTITVRNESGADLSFDSARGAGGVYLADAIPRTFRYVDGSAVALVRNLSTSRAEAFPVSVEGELLLNFGAVLDGEHSPISLPADSELELRYFLVAGSDTEPGRSYTNRAELQAADTGIVLSNVDTVEIRIGYDPVFDQGVVIGRVFCDADEDGRFDRGETGLAGARIFLDSGYYTDVDSSGQYHFSEIDPGLHLIKIDTDTIPPGSTITSEETRAFNVTRGLPSQIDFGVACNENYISDFEVLPGDGVLAEAARMRRIRFFEALGNTADPLLLIDDVEIPLMSAELYVATGAAPAFPASEPAGDPIAEEAAVEAVEIEPEPEPEVPSGPSPFASVGDEPAPVDEPAPMAVEEPTPIALAEAPSSEGLVDVRVEGGALVDPIGVSLRTSNETSRWVFEVADLSSGVVVYQRVGETPGDAQFEWDGTDESGALVLEPESVYEMRLRAISGESRYAAASPIALRVADTREAYLVEAVRHGDLFDDRRPNAELVELLDGVRADLMATAPARVVVEAHLDDRDEVADEDNVSLEQATVVAEYIEAEFGIPPDRIEVRGMGVREPIYPNIGERTRNTNRRIEVLVVDPNPDIRVPDAPGSLQPPARAQFGERTVEPGEGGEFTALVPRPDDGLVVASVTDDTGMTRATLVAVREGANASRATAALPSVEVAVHAPNAEVTVGGAVTSVAALRTRVEVENPVGRLSGRMLNPSMRFPFVDVPEGVEAWSFEVFEVGSGSVFILEGEGAPPGGQRWQGRTDDGGAIVAGTYEARLTLRFAGGGMATTAPVAFAVMEDPPEDATFEASVVQEPTVIRVNGVLLDAPDGVAITSITGATGRTVLVDVIHGGARAVVPVTIPDGFEMQVEREIPLEPFSIFVDPLLQPVDNRAPADIAGPTDSALETTNPAPAPTDETEEEAPGLLAPRGNVGTPFDTVLEEAEDESMVIEPAEPEETPPVPEEPTEAFEEAPSPFSNDQPVEGEEAAEDEDTENEEAEDEETEDEESGGDGDDADEEPEPEDDSPFSPFSPASSADGWFLRPAQAPAFHVRGPSYQFSPFNPTDGSEPAESDASEPLAEPSTDAPAPIQAPAAPLGSSYADLLDYHADALAVALATDALDELARALAEADAGQISVQLPPQGVPLTSNRLPIYGTTVPTNEVYVNGQGIRVRSDGSFDGVVELPAGESDLVVETVDLDGNRGRVDWPVNVNSSSFFMLALADTAVGSRDADIAGTHDHNSRTTDGGVQLYGQARLYLKGWVSGEEILDGFFGDLEVTAHVDTGKRREYESFMRETIQPDRSYPVFGDGSEQVSDVNSRGKVYVLLEAGDSSATWGNFNTEIEGVELLRYERNLYGAQIDFDEVAGEDYRTEVQLHVADEEESVTQTYNYLRGTGGSIYYLQDRPVVEGSERVALVVRDSISGVELGRFPQRRNDDYTVRYSEGRIIMKSPVPSIADDGLLIGNYTTSRNLLQGHPVYIEVAYDHESVRNGSELSYGAHARETFFDLVNIGGGIVEESRAGAPGYTLWGVEAGVGPTDRTRLDVEYARSESNDLGYAYSDDGGLSFQRFRLDDGTDSDGRAILVRGSVELADLLNTDRDELFAVGGYYQDSERGFFANGRILDQGELRYGADVNAAFNERNRLHLRMDHVESEMDDLSTDEVLDTVTIMREVLQAEYNYRLGFAGLRLGYEHTTSNDPRLGRSFTNDVIGAGVDVEIARRFRLGVRQEIIANGDDPRIIRGSGGDGDTRLEDRFITALEAGYRVVDDLELTATQRFRYSGESSALVGLRAAVSEDSDVYVQQRVASERDNSGSATSTVVGGEQRYGEDGSGRSYGEYHVDNGIHGSRSRAVLGFGKRWRIADGLSIDVGYERSNTLGGESVQSDSSRDTVSFGWEYVGLDTLKMSGLLEGRFERGSLHTPSLGTCLATDISGNPTYCRDRVSSLGDRRQLVTLTTVELQATQDVTLFGRFDMVVTENTTLNVLESRDTEGTVGFAFRPIEFNWLNVLARYTYLGEMAPYQLELNTRREEQSHVFSFAPMFELPYNLQLVEKIAYRNIRLDVEGMPEVTNNLTLLINRVNYHIFRQWDVGVEYRFLHQSLTRDWRHGFLLEANYIVADHVRLGLGYNFTKFAEDELGDFDRDASGIFFRVTAQY